MDPSATYRGRLAPSPTGYLHIGHARTFHRAWLRAREAGGRLVMRMEDLDPDRSRPEYVSAALEDLRWLGLDWDEGPDLGGPFAPYAQSARHHIYLAAWRKLYDGGFIYPCRCSRKDLAAALSAPHESDARPQDPDDEPVYPGTCRPSRTGEGVFDLLPHPPPAPAAPTGDSASGTGKPSNSTIATSALSASLPALTSAISWSGAGIRLRVISWPASPTTPPCKSLKSFAAPTFLNQQRARSCSIAHSALPILAGSTAN